MALVTRKGIARYLYESLTGNFLGFLIGMSASGLVSRFFETKGLRNLWGLTAKKTVVSKETFGWLEWVIALVIGFVVFEVVNKVLKAYIQKEFPKLKVRLFRLLIQKQWHLRLRDLSSNVRAKRVSLYTMMSMRNGTKSE
ncbi:hypothetical protein [Pseudochryseolinea flava]|nr:hypothetical protein [Pseudochryseolinea flava]